MTPIKWDPKSETAPEPTRCQKARQLSEEGTYRATITEIEVAESRFRPRCAIAIVYFTLPGVDGEYAWATKLTFVEDGPFAVWQPLIPTSVAALDHGPGEYTLTVRKRTTKVGGDVLLFCWERP